MESYEIINQVLQNAGIDSSSLYKPDNYTQHLLRYYREDIPKKPRYLFDADALFFYNCDDAIRSVQDQDKRRFYAELGDIMTSIWTPLSS